MELTMNTTVTLNNGIKNAYAGVWHCSDQRESGRNN